MMVVSLPELVHVELTVCFEPALRPSNDLLTCRPLHVIILVMSFCHWKNVIADLLE